MSKLTKKELTEKTLEECQHLLRQVKFGLKFQNSTKSPMYKNVEVLIQKISKVRSMKDE
jgi:hypothetical protein